MTGITVYRGPMGSIMGFRVAGHARARVKTGGDIVCSAISVMAYTAVNAMETVAGVVTQPREEDGLLEVFLPRDMTEQQEHDCQIILRTALQGFSDIEQGYPRHARVVWKEWREHHAETESATVRP